MQTRPPSEWPTYLLNPLSAVACSSVITHWITLHNLQTLLAPLPGLLLEAPHLWLRCLSCFAILEVGDLVQTKSDTRSYFAWMRREINVYQCKHVCRREANAHGNFQQISEISFCLSIREKPMTRHRAAIYAKGQKGLVLKMLAPTLTQGCIFWFVFFFNFPVAFLPHAVRNNLFHFGGFMLISLIVKVNIVF